MGKKRTVRKNSIINRLIEIHTRIRSFSLLFFFFCYFMFFEVEKKVHHFITFHHLNFWNEIQKNKKKNVSQKTTIQSETQFAVRLHILQHTVIHFAQREKKTVILGYNDVGPTIELSFNSPQSNGMMNRLFEFLILESINHSFRYLKVI